MTEQEGYIGDEDQRLLQYPQGQQKRGALRNGNTGQTEGGALEALARAEALGGWGACDW